MVMSLFSCFGGRTRKKNRSHINNHNKNESHHSAKTDEYNGARKDKEVKKSTNKTAVQYEESDDDTDQGMMTPSPSQGNHTPPAAADSKNDMRKHSVQYEERHSDEAGAAHVLVEFDEDWQSHISKQEKRKKKKNDFQHKRLESLNQSISSHELEPNQQNNNAHRVDNSEPKTSVTSCNKLNQAKSSTASHESVHSKHQPHNHAVSNFEVLPTPVKPLTEKEKKHQELVEAIRQKYNCGESEEYIKKRSHLSLDKYKPSASSSTNHNDLDIQPRERTAKSVGSIAQMKQAMLERGERVRLLDDKTTQMKNSASNLSTSMNALAEKYKNKKWYEF